MQATSSYDYARLIAAFGIVVFHAGSVGAAIGYAALPFFLMLIVALGWTSAERSDFPRYVKGRSQRLLRPWLVWSAVYGALKLAEVVVYGIPLADEFAPYMVLTGPAIHLWFLPFAFLVCLLLWPLTRQAGWLVGGAAFLAALALQAFNQGQDLPIPLVQWAYVAPAVCLGFCLAASPQKASVPVLCAFVGLSLAFGWTAGLLQMALAAGALILCQWIVLPQTSLSRKLALASMGVYLVHPLVFSVCERVLPLDKSTFSTAVLVALVSLLIALVLGHFQSRNTASRSAVRG